MRHWTDRLSEYLDGDLSPDEERAVEEHLDACPRCASVLEELREVVRVAASVEERPPARDLWPGIRDEIRSRGEPGVADLGSARGERVGVPSPERGWIRISIPGLVAAALALAFFSGAGAWMLRGSLEGGGRGGGEPGSVSPAVHAVDGSSEAVQEYASEIRELELILDGYRERLAPATVRVLERNLAVIDRAIAESREALESDPGNAYLEDHLKDSLRRKVQFLREAATTLEVTT